MTIEEMNNVIQTYCHDKPCSNCIISNVCNPIAGLFIKHGDECKKAYEIITAGKQAETKIHDEVNRPAHYAKGKYECIDVMIEALGVHEVKSFCLCNAFKYIYRCKTKNMTPTSDIRKAVWYLNKYLELEDRKL